MDRKMVMGFTNMEMEIFTKGNGKMIKSKVRVSSFMETVIFMLANSLKDGNRVKEFINGPTEIYMKEILQKI